ncbi:MAG: hypothetical protein IJK13_02320 [Lachnospiraceae bacterium]|nr:hypothetical protein [Lachnospiraceae bacterium]MBR0434824.1 hypothetical protein [Lachnospiraceae bacterium]
MQVQIEDVKLNEEEAFVEALEEAEIVYASDGTCNSQACGRCRSKVF